MIWFKSCTKCRGDLTEGSDTYGPYVACMQCSHYLTEAEEADLALGDTRPYLWPATSEQVKKLAA